MKKLFCILLCLVAATLLAHPTGTWLGYNEETGKYLPILLNASGAAMVEGIGSVPESYYKSAIDTANQESSADFDTAAALVTSNYAGISSAIASKGIDMAGVIPSGYNEKVGLIGDKYVRPSFWPELPEIAVDENGEPTEEVIYFLIAVPENGCIFSIYQLQGNSIIDWGDGTSSYHTTSANNIFKHYENWDSIPSPINERGYKCAIIEIRAQEGQNLTSIYLNSNYNNTSLEIKIAVQNSIATYNQIIIWQQTMLEIINIVGKSKFQVAGATSGIGYLCPALRKLVLNTENTKNAKLCFSGNSIVPENISLKSCTNCTYALYNSYSGTNLNLIAPDISQDGSFLAANSHFISINIEGAERFTNLTSAFANAYKLQELNIANVKVSFSIINTPLNYYEIKRIIENDLGTPDTSATLTITGTPDAAQIMADIGTGTITVPTGWTIAN